jgi:predicted aspartyl protease
MMGKAPCFGMLAVAIVAMVGGEALADTRPVPVPPVKMAPLTPAEIDDALAIGGDDVAADMVRTRMTTDVLVNGRGPYRFVVDSGADSSVVGLGVAQALQLPPGSPVIVNGMTGSARVERVLVDELTLGPTTVRNLELPALRERDLGGEGMLGIDALVRQRLMMDFEKRLIKVEDAESKPVRLDGEIIVTARTRRGQLILTQVKAAGLPVEAVIDTGSEITIGNLALRDKLIKRYADRFMTVAITGVTGQKMNLQIARIGELRLGPVILKNVPMAFADVPPFSVFGLDKQPSMLLGTDLLETFRRVSLDFRARKVRFQLKKCGSTGIAINTTPMASLTRISSDDRAAVCKR